MKMKQWYQGHDRVSDEEEATGTNRASYHAREPIEDDDERFAMTQSDMPPPVPERVANPRIREDRVVQDFQWNSEKMHRATCEEAGPDVGCYNVSTCQCSILFNNMGSFNRKSEFRKAENIDKPNSSKEKYHVASDPKLSLLTEFWGYNYAHVILTAKADRLVTDAKELLNDCGLVGCHSSKSNDLSVHARINSSGYIRL